MQKFIVLVTSQLACAIQPTSRCDTSRHSIETGYAVAETIARDQYREVEHPLGRPREAPFPFARLSTTEGVLVDVRRRVVCCTGVNTVPGPCISYVADSSLKKLLCSVVR